MPHAGRIRALGVVWLLASGVSLWSCGSSGPGDGTAGAPSHAGAAGNVSVGGSWAGDVGSGGGAGSAGDGGLPEAGHGGTKVGGCDGLVDCGNSGSTSIAGAAGTSGGSGAAGTGGTGEIGGTSGNGGAGGAATSPSLVLSRDAIAFLPNDCGAPGSPPLTFTITNTSNATVDWSATLAQQFAFFSVAPSGSSLAPGGVATVTVTSLPIADSSVPPALMPELSGSIGISGDPAGPQSVTVREILSGFGYTWTPTELNFGDVRIGETTTLPITVTPLTPKTMGVQLGSEDSAFTASRFNQARWTVTFAPTSPGPQTGTLRWASQLNPSAPSCTPSTFTATGRGTLQGSADCSKGPFLGVPCGPSQVCGPFPSGCITQLTLAGSRVSFTLGEQFSGVVASGTTAYLPSSPLTATIDWGDQTVSPGTVVAPSGQATGSTIPLTVSGAHTYATAGTFQGMVTVTDSVTTFSVQASFTASN
jgi:hypothetical protein